MPLEDGIASRTSSPPAADPRIVQPQPDGNEAHAGPPLDDLLPCCVRLVDDRREDLQLLGRRREAVPGIFSAARSRRLHQGGAASRRVADTFQKIAFDPARKSADLMGSLNAGWADMGLHPETFWLGYATAAAAAWHPGSPDPAESVSRPFTLCFTDTVSRRWIAFTNS